MLVLVKVVAFKERLYRIPSQEESVFLNYVSIFPVVVVDVFQVEVIFTAAGNKRGSQLLIQ